MYKVKAKIKFQDGNGKMANGTTSVLSSAICFFDAEQDAEKFLGFCEDYEITKMEVVRDMEVVGKDSDKFFSIKYDIVTVDEVSAREKKQRFEMLVGAQDIDEAKGKADEHFKGSVSDIVVVSIKESEIKFVS